MSHCSLLFNANTHGTDTAALMSVRIFRSLWGQVTLPFELLGSSHFDVKPLRFMLVTLRIAFSGALLRPKLSALKFMSHLTRLRL